MNQKGFVQTIVIVAVITITAGIGGYFVIKKGIGLPVTQKVVTTETSTPTVTQSSPTLTYTQTAMFTPTISPPPLLTVISPNGGEKIQAGSLVTVRFKLNSEGYIEKFIPWFKKYGGMNWSDEYETWLRNKLLSPQNLEYVNLGLAVESKQSGNDSTFLYLPSGIPPAGDISIKVPITDKTDEYSVQVKVPFWLRPADNYRLTAEMGSGQEKDEDNTVINSFSFISDKSDGTITISKPAIKLSDLRIISPNGGEEIKAGNQYIIKWNGAENKIEGRATHLSFYLIDETKKYLLEEDEDFSPEIGRIQSPQVSGSFTWDGKWNPYKESGRIIPPAGSNYRIKGVLSVSGQGFDYTVATDESDSVFSVVK